MGLQKINIGPSVPNHYPNLKMEGLLAIVSLLSSSDFLASLDLQEVFDYSYVPELF